MFTKRINQALVATTFALVLASPLNVHADEPTSPSIILEEETAPSAISSDVTINRPSIFSVRIPKLVSYTNPTSDSFGYTVQVKGNLSDSQKLTVIPQTDEVIFTSNGGRTNKASVSLETTEWSHSNIDKDNYTESNGLLTVEHAIKSGTWKTNIIFDVALSDYVPSYGFFDVDGNILSSWENAEKVGMSNYISQHKSEIIKVVIPDGVTSIGDSAFKSCKNLTSITIPNSVISIGDDAFEFCYALTSITIPDGVTTIGEEAFYYCDNLTSINIPDSVTSIGEQAFSGCKVLTTITIPDGVTSISYGTFEFCDALTTITIPDSVTSIGDDAFANCPSLASIIIPDSVTSIGEYAFQDCDALTSITIPNSVTSISYCAFENCDALTSITIPDSVTSIDYGAFENCDALASITIPDSVTSIGNYAFAWSSNLASVTYKGVEYTSKSALQTALKNNSVTFGTSAFSYTKLTS